MIRWELRKSLNVILILTAAVLCAAWFFVCKNLFVGKYEDINGAIYRSYVLELSELSRDEQREFIENENLRIGLILSAQTENQSKYLHGDMSDEDYLKYLDDLDDCKAKRKTFEYIQTKFERISKTDELRFTYDLELEGYLTTMTADFPLIVLLMIAGCGVFIADIPQEPFIRTCKNGRGKTYAAKLAVMLITGGVLITAFNFAELAALFSKDLGDLSAPAASMDKFAALDADISCFAVIVKTFLFRIVGEFAVSAAFFSISQLCGNYFAFFCAAAAVVMIPAFFVNILPAAFRGIVYFYPLSGNTVLLDQNELFTVLWSLALTVGSPAAAFLIKEKSGRKRYS